MASKYTLEKAKGRIEELNPNIEVIDTEYLGGNHRMLCKCRVDGHVFRASLASVRSGRGCPKCGGRAPLTMYDIKEDLKITSPTIIIIDDILDDAYVRSTAKLKCKCSVCGLEFKASRNNLNAGKGCSHCSIKLGAEHRTHTYDYVIESLAILCPDVEILSTSYVKSTENLICKCKIDETIFEKSYTRLKDGAQCPACSKRKISGENNQNWKGGISPLAMHLRWGISQWKKDSMRDSNYKCVISGENFDHIHHIYGFDLILKETLEIEKIELKPTFSDYTDLELRRLENTCADLHKKYGLGVALSESEHNLFHQTYGYGENNHKQWTEFLTNRKEHYNKQST